jgi:hypothetical protein
MDRQTHTSDDVVRTIKSIFRWCGWCGKDLQAHILDGVVWTVKPIYRWCELDHEAHILTLFTMSLGFKVSGGKLVCVVVVVIGV